MGPLRAIAASYWTALALGVGALALHVRWYMVDKAAGGEVVSGFGAALVALGVLVGSRPYIRNGLLPILIAGLPRFAADPPDEPIERWSSYVREVDRVRPSLLLDIWAERVLAVAVVIVGTLLNGYGPLIARLLGLRSS